MFKNLSDPGFDSTYHYKNLPPSQRLVLREMKGVKSAPRLDTKGELMTMKLARRNAGGAFGSSKRKKSFRIFGSKASSSELSESNRGALDHKWKKIQGGVGKHKELGTTAFA